MEVPKRVDCPEGHVLLVLQSLYGLKQSANLWNKRIKKMVKTLGFDPIHADASIFINKRGIIIRLYIDDLLILAKNESEIIQVKNKIKKVHIMKDLGEVKKILGIHVTRGPNRSVKIDQHHYIQRVLVEFGMENTRDCLCK